MEEMLKRGLSIGGEQSGHVIFSEHLFTGDGIATALNVLRVMAETGRELADLAAELVTYPQVLVNVRVREKKDLHSVPAIAAAMDRRRGPARRPGPPAGALLRHRAAAARDDRGEGPARDPGLGRRDRRRRQGAPGMTAVDAGRGSASTSTRSRRSATRAAATIPSVLEAVDVCIAAGAPGITVHPRADARHITVAGRARRSPRRSRRGAARVEFNIEGDPRADLLELVHDVRPDQCTLVPVQPGEITSQAGWPADTPRGMARRRSSSALQNAGVRVSLFIDPEPRRGALGGSDGRRPHRALHRAVRARVRARPGREAQDELRAIRGRRDPRARARPRRERRPRPRPRQPGRCSERSRTSTRCRSAMRSSATRCSSGSTAPSATT